MKRVYDGYAVETDKQILLKGNWDQDDCMWDWESSYSYFFERDAAEKYFHKQKKVLSSDIPIIRLLECKITEAYGEYRYDVGDPLLEMDLTDHGIEIWEP